MQILFSHVKTEHEVYQELCVQKIDDKKLKITTFKEFGGSRCDEPQELKEFKVSIKGSSFFLERGEVFIIEHGEKRWSISLEMDEEEDYELWDPEAVSENRIDENRQFPYFIKMLEEAGVKRI